MFKKTKNKNQKNPKYPKIGDKLNIVINSHTHSIQALESGTLSNLLFTGADNRVRRMTL